MPYSIALAIAVVAAVVSAVGGAVYLAWNLSWPAVILILVLSAGVSFLILRYIFGTKISRSGLASGGLASPVFSTPLAEIQIQQQSRLWALGLVPLAALAAICWLTLSRNQIDTAVNTPWTHVPLLFWIALALAAAGGAALLLRAGTKTAWLAATLLIGVGVSVALVIYRIGYGFDPFIHQAAEEHILGLGVITPKTPYYAGQYALVVALARLTKLPIQLLDAWLLPSLATIGIASTLALAARAKKSGLGTWAAALLALLPLSPFINTTPFGLASLYTLLAAIVGLAAKDEPRLKAVVWTFAAAALLTHPIAGVPALILAALIQFRQPLVRAALALGGAVILPAMFAVVGQGFSFSIDRLRTLSLPFELPITRFHAWGDPLYALGLIAAASIVIAVAWNRVYLLAAASAALSGILVAVTIDFSYLPDSEQSGYAARVLLIALLIAVPAASLVVSRLLEKALADPWRSLVAVLGIAFFFVGGVYLAYPRSDAYVISKGWNTSSADLAAVRAVNDDANGQPYIVLAAQPVSAAALKEFGFFKYYDTAQGQVFAYPVPTGGPLYQYYLKMIYDDPSSEYMRQAMDLSGVKRGYFIVNSYWTGADHFISRAKLTSTKWFGINDADYVFEYNR